MLTDDHHQLQSLSLNINIQFMIIRCEKVERSSSVRKHHQKTNAVINNQVCNVAQRYCYC